MQGRYRVLNWTDYHRNFFAALKMEKRMMGLLLFFIVVIVMLVTVLFFPKAPLNEESYWSEHPEHKREIGDLDV